MRVRALARDNPRYGYRRIKALRVHEGWSVNLKRVHRVWRREGLKEAKVLVEDHRLGNNHHRPHSARGYRTPAEFAAAQIQPGVASLPPAASVPLPDPATPRISS